MGRTVSTRPGVRAEASAITGVGRLGSGTTTSIPPTWIEAAAVVSQGERQGLSINSLIVYSHY
jgi:hypothetical protein